MATVPSDGGAYLKDNGPRLIATDPVFTDASSIARWMRIVKKRVDPAALSPADDSDLNHNPHRPRKMQDAINQRLQAGAHLAALLGDQASRFDDLHRGRAAGANVWADFNAAELIALANQVQAGRSSGLSAHQGLEALKMTLQRIGDEALHHPSTLPSQGRLLLNRGQSLMLTRAPDYSDPLSIASYLRTASDNLMPEGWSAADQRAVSKRRQKDGRTLAGRLRHWAEQFEAIGQNLNSTSQDKLLIRFKAENLPAAARVLAFNPDRTRALHANEINNIAQSIDGIANNFVPAAAPRGTWRPGLLSKVARGALWTVGGAGAIAAVGVAGVVGYEYLTNGEHPAPFPADAKLAANFKAAQAKGIESVLLCRQSDPAETLAGAALLQNYKDDTIKVAKGRVDDGIEQIIAAAAKGDRAVLVMDRMPVGYFHGKDVSQWVHAPAIHGSNADCGPGNTMVGTIRFDSAMKRVADRTPG